MAALPESAPVLPTFADVREAARRIAGIAHRTPVLTSRTADRQVGGRLFFKAENLQRAGAFKFRGACNAIAALSPERRARQTRRADYWIRTRKLLRTQIVGALQRPGRDARISRVTESLGPRTVASEDEWNDSFFDSSEDLVPSRVLETGPGNLV